MASSCKHIKMVTLPHIRNWFIQITCWSSFIAEEILTFQTCVYVRKVSFYFFFQLIAKGKNASELFPAVVKNVASKNLEVKASYL